MQQDEQDPSTTQEGAWCLPSRASRGRRRRFSGAWEGESGARGAGPSAEKNLLRSSLHTQRGRGSVVTSRPFCAANRPPRDLAWTLPCPGGQSRDRVNPLPRAGLPAGSPQAFGSRCLPARVLGPGLRWAHLECEVNPGVGRTPRGRACGQRRAGRRRRHSCPLGCVARRRPRLGPCSLWACPP